MGQPPPIFSLPSVWVCCTATHSKEVLTVSLPSLGGCYSPDQLLNIHTFALLRRWLLTTLTISTPSHSPSHTPTHDLRSQQVEASLYIPLLLRMKCSLLPRSPHLPVGVPLTPLSTHPSPPHFPTYTLPPLVPW